MRISDWSSDVCSSDLKNEIAEKAKAQAAYEQAQAVNDHNAKEMEKLKAAEKLARQLVAEAQERARIREIGRASCRERECQYVWITVVAVSFKKEKKRTQIVKNTYTQHN